MRGVEEGGERADAAHAIDSGAVLGAEPFDPQANVAAGTKYLRQLLDKYKGDLQLTLAAYNSGPGAVDAAGGVPNIAETKGYVDAIVGVMGIKQIELPSLAAAPPIAPPILLDAIHP